jgi:hypothetical protein
VQRGHWPGGRGGARWARWAAVLLDARCSQAVVGEAGAVSVTAVSGVREVLPGRLIIGGELCIVYAAPIGARELDYSHSVCGAADGLVIALLSGRCRTGPYLWDGWFRARAESFHWHRRTAWVRHGLASQWGSSSAPGPANG